MKKDQKTTTDVISPEEKLRKQRLADIKNKLDWGQKLTFKERNFLNINNKAAKKAKQKAKSNGKVNR